jgi:hypothetical protein
MENHREQEVTERKQNGNDKECTETTEEAEPADRPADGPASAHRSQLHNSKSKTFGVYVTLRGAGALLACLIRRFRLSAVSPCIQLQLWPSVKLVRDRLVRIMNG